MYFARNTIFRVASIEFIEWHFQFCHPNSHFRTIAHNIWLNCISLQWKVVWLLWMNQNIILKMLYSLLCCVPCSVYEAELTENLLSIFDDFYLSISYALLQKPFFMLPLKCSTFKIMWLLSDDDDVDDDESQSYVL